MKVRLLVLLLVVPALGALLKPGYFPMHDDIQGMRVLQMVKCLADFQIPCRWVPDMGYGYGYPQFNYYSPLPYYLMSVLVFLGIGILDSVKLGFAASIVFSGLAMYSLGSYLWGKKGGVASALFYTYAPYRAVDIYVRGAMGEAWGFVFMPLIILFSLRGSVLPLSLVVAGLLLAHNVTSLMFIPFYVLFMLFYGKPKFSYLKKVLACWAWGGAMAAFFVLPAFLEKEYVHINSILSGYFNYLAHFVGIKQIFFSTFWGYGVSGLGDLDGMALHVGLLQWTVPVFVLLVLLYLGKFRTAKTVAVFVALAIAALFLMHPKSSFVWSNIGLLHYIQFPWRFLAIAVVFFSLAAGAISKLFARKAFLIIIFAVVLLLNGYYFRLEEQLLISDEEKFSGESWVKQQTISILDYLPKAASHPPTSPALDTPEILGTKGRVFGERGSNWQKWNVNFDEPGRLRLQIIDFPEWRVTVDGREVQADSNNELGLLAVDVSAGEHIVEANLKDTPLRTFSNFISLFAVLGIVVYLLKRRR